LDIRDVWCGRGPHESLGYEEQLLLFTQDHHCAVVIAYLDE
jgi:hypothetical protein